MKPIEEMTLVEKLRTRAEIRRNIKDRKSVQEGKPDRIADLLEEAANFIEYYEEQESLHELHRQHQDDLIERLVKCNKELLRVKDQVNWTKVQGDNLNWNLPPKGVDVLVYKPNCKYVKYFVDQWNDLYEAPVSWSSATICIGDGWQEEDDMEAITHWAYLNEPEVE